jgi:hypothetical protein
MMGYRVAVVGATGAVGREMLKTLAERNFPISDIAAVASGRSSGTELSFGEDRVLKTQNLEKFREPRSRPFTRREQRPPAASSSTIPASSAWIRTCRWWCPRSIPAH